MGDGMVQQIIDRIAPKVVVPHHYYIWNVVQRQSTLLPVTGWLANQSRVRSIDEASQQYSKALLPAEMSIDYFGDNVAFDVNHWHRLNGMEPG